MGRHKMTGAETQEKIKEKKIGKIKKTEQSKLRAAALQHGGRVDERDFRGHISSLLTQEAHVLPNFWKERW